MQYASILATVVALSPAAASFLDTRALSGQATFYGGNVAGGTCSFSTYTLPSGIFGTALSDSNWENSGNCGACVAVTGPNGNTITAMVVDQCPGCGPNHLDLFPDAFAALASPSTGVIDTTWSYVKCPITSALQLHNKEGVSAYWFSMQVVNANQAVSKLEVSTNGGSTWQATERQTYNFFQASSGFGTTSVDVKVTAEDGSTVVVENVNISSGTSMTASGNFGSSADAVPSIAPSSPIVVAKHKAPSSATESTASAEPTEFLITAVAPSAAPAATSNILSSSTSPTSSKMSKVHSSSTSSISVPGALFHDVGTSTKLASSSTSSRSKQPHTTVLAAHSSQSFSMPSFQPSAQEAVTVTVYICPLSTTSMSLFPTTVSITGVLAITSKMSIPASVPTSIVYETASKSSSTAARNQTASATTSLGLVKATTNAAADAGLRGMGGIFGSLALVAALLI